MTDNQPASLTHVRADGTAHMVDVSTKPETTRTATAAAVVRTRADVIAQLLDGSLPKGDALAVARVAGIMAAKKTPELVPLCHPLPISKVTVDFAPVADDAAALAVEATVKTRGVTGVEMEALTAVSVAALTVYDMIKAVDKHAVIDSTRVLAKAGGKSGDWDTRVAAGENAPGGGAA
ncbi:cyclic pyranopterin monophosphate synthase MoaC [Zhihengliuella somnathii]